MEWLNEPASWQRNGDVVRVSVDPDTDFWRATGYGYVHDNGHVYGDRLPGDLDVSVRIRGAFASQYDQAGIMLRADERTWLKTGLEFFEGRPRLSTVVTMGWSSWMVADLPPGTDEVILRVSRRGDAVEVRYVAGDGAAELAALVFMPPDREMLAGIVCAAPAGTGFSVAFHDLRIVGREWGGQEVADGAGWAGEAAAWQDEPAGDLTAGWAADEDRDAEPGWARDRRGDRAAGWAGDKSGLRADDPAGDMPGEATGGWDVVRPGEAAGGWDVVKPGVPEPGWTGERPAGKTPAGRKSAAGVPDGWDDELPGDESLDWAKPQASEPAADWDRLSLSLSSSSWNAFAAATPPEQPGEPARERPSKPAEQASQGREAGAGERPGPPAGEQPQSPAGDRAEPAPAPAGPAEAAKPDEPERGKNGRGKNKAKVPVTPALPPPADPADEWISLLTADSTEELSGPGPEGELSGPTPDEPDPG